MFSFSLRHKIAQGLGKTDVVTVHSSFIALVSFSCQLDIIQTHLKRVSMKRLSRSGWSVGMSVTSGCVLASGRVCGQWLSVVNGHVYDDLSWLS